MVAQTSHQEQPRVTKHEPSIMTDMGLWECTPNNVPLIRTLQLTLKSIPTSGGRCQQQSFCQNAHSTSPPNPTQIMIVFSLGCLFPTALKYILSFLLLAFRLQLPMILETWKMKFFCFIVAPQSTTTATSAGRPYPTAHAQVEASSGVCSRMVLSGLSALGCGWEGRGTLQSSQLLMSHLSPVYPGASTKTKHKNENSFLMAARAKVYVPRKQGKIMFEA